MASYRYRCLIPAAQIGATVNDESADVWVLSKIQKDSMDLYDKARAFGKRFVVDVCDAYLGRPTYQYLIRHADAVTSSSTFTARMIEEDFGVPCTVIDDPYEFPELTPHVTNQERLFWFGHAQNYYSMAPYAALLKDKHLRQMSNIEGFIPWSTDRLQEELCQTDIVLIPETAPYKSANRAIEAIRQGCFVVAEPHPALEEIPGLCMGNILKGITWVTQHPQDANRLLTQSQAYVRERFSPERVGNAWRTLLQTVPLKSTSAVAISPGLDGSTLMETEPVDTPIYAPI